MNRHSRQETIASVLLGMSIGESLSWVTPFSRSQAMPQWLSRIRNKISAENYQRKLTTMPLPFALNQNTGPLQSQPGDLTEWAAWSAKLLIENDTLPDRKTLLAEWQTLAKSEPPVRGRLSIQAALHNIRQGLTSPQSGNFNPHYFDDGALPRAVVIGALFAGQAERASHFVALDAAFTHFEDGIFSAQALAAALSLAADGAEIQQIIDAALSQLPDHSLSRRQVGKALAFAESCGANPLALAFFLSNELFSLEYSYGNAAHDVLAASLAILKVSTHDFNSHLMAAALISRAGSGLMAITGALAGARFGIPRELTAQIQPLEGYFVPAVKGISLFDLAEKLSRKDFR